MWRPSRSWWDTLRQSRRTSICGCRTRFGRMCSCGTWRDGLRTTRRARTRCRTTSRCGCRTIIPGGRCRAGRRRSRRGGTKDLGSGGWWRRFRTRISGTTRRSLSWRTTRRTARTTWMRIAAWRWRSANMRRMGRAAELIAHAANGLDEIVAALQLLAQVADVHVDGAIEGCGFAVIEILHEGVAGEDAAGGAHQHFENIEFEGGEFDAFAVGDHFAGAGVERDAVAFNAVGGRRGTGLVAAQDGANAGGEFAGVEGLGQIIVGAEFQADDAVDILAAGGEHEHRDFGFEAEAAQDFEAIDAGEHDVEHHQIDAGLQGAFQAAVALIGCLHGKAFAAEELAQERGEFGVVIDQQDVHGSNLPRGGGRGTLRGFCDRITRPTPWRHRKLPLV